MLNGLLPCTPTVVQKSYTLSRRQRFWNLRQKRPPSHAWENLKMDLYPRVMREWNAFRNIFHATFRQNFKALSSAFAIYCTGRLLYDKCVEKYSEQEFWIGSQLCFLNIYKNLQDFTYIIFTYIYFYVKHIKHFLSCCICNAIILILAYMQFIFVSLRRIYCEKDFYA